MKDTVYKKGLAIVLAIVFVVIIAVGINLTNKEKDIIVSNGNISENETDKILKENEIEYEVETNTVPNVVVVDIDGEVVNPGVYEFQNGDRVNDAIVRAGGLKENADTKYINKARPLVDGEKIYIAQNGEEDLESVVTNEEAQSIITENINTSSDKIDINTASKELLMTLTGIGDAYSQRIIEYRDKTKFSSIEEIKNVKGIGEKTFENIKEKITVN